MADRAGTPDGRVDPELGRQGLRRLSDTLSGRRSPPWGQIDAIVRFCVAINAVLDAIKGQLMPLLSSGWIVAWAAQEGLSLVADHSMYNVVMDMVSTFRAWLRLLVSGASVPRTVRDQLHCPEDIDPRAMEGRDAADQWGAGVGTRSISMPPTVWEEGPDTLSVGSHPPTSLDAVGENVLSPAQYLPACRRCGGRHPATAGGCPF